MYEGNFLDETYPALRVRLRTPGPAILVRRTLRNPMAVTRRGIQWTSTRGGRGAEKQVGRRSRSVTEEDEKALGRRRQSGESR